MHYFAILLILLLSGCHQSQIPDVQQVRQQLDIPAHWSETLPGGMQVSPPEAWWTLFQDPQINQLIGLVLIQNSDLSQAVFRLREAEFRAGEVATSLAPTVSGSLEGGTSKQLNHGQPSVRSYSSRISLSYEVDLWGRVAGMNDAAHFEMQATAADLDAARLKLIGTTLELYWRSGWLLRRLELWDEESGRLAHLLRLAKGRYQSGDGTMLDVLQAQQDMDQHLRLRQQMLFQQQKDRHALAVLLGQSPLAPLPFRAEPLRNKPFMLNVKTLPVSLFARRPDMRAAEYRLRAQLLDTEVTRKSFYPGLSLNGSLGAGAGRDMLKIFHDPIGSLGGSILLPFLQFNQIQVKIGTSEMQYMQSVEGFKSAFYTALKETEDALASRTYYYEESHQLSRSEARSLKAYDIAEVAWRHGLLSFQDVLEQKARLASVRQQIVENQFNQYVAEAQLLMTLGGGARENSEADSIASASTVPMTS